MHMGGVGQAAKHLQAHCFRGRGGHSKGAMGPQQGPPQELLPARQCSALGLAALRSSPLRRSHLPWTGH